jgi:ADP-ribosylglycohydrolase
MLGAIAGDIVGSVYEGEPIKSKVFPLFVDASQFTDDTVLTIAVADVLLHGGSYGDTFRRYFRRYRDRGFGAAFARWAESQQNVPYGSFGNGAAMRVSSVAWLRHSLDEVLAETRRSAKVSHNHPEGIKGAQATAAAIFLARTGESRDGIRKQLTARFGYDLGRSLQDIRPDYHFDVSCQGSVPQSIIAFLESVDFEDALRNAVSLGGDSDTMACIAGGIAEAFYGGVPQDIWAQVVKRLDGSLLQVVANFGANRIAPSAC